VALVTGASGGIGRELAALLARDGHPLVLVARDQGALDRVAEEFRERHGVAVTPLAFDLARAEAPGELVAEIERRGLAVETLVNNAGFGGSGPFAEGDVERDLAMLRVNVLALTALTGRLLPAMVARGRGRVLNLASTAAFQPGPFMAVYYASKAYVLSFSEAIAEELAGSGVTVTALCPGPTDTAFQHRAGTADSRTFRSRNVLDAPRVAAAGYAGMLAGKRVVIPGGLNWLGAEAVRFLPRRVVTRIVRRLQEGDTAAAP
jgi:short-subunit dehydrogenase